MKTIQLVALTFVLGMILAVPGFAADKVTIAQFGKEKFLLYLPLYIAMEEGYFQKQNIDVDLIFAGNDDQIFAAVAGGSADFGMGDPIFTAIAQEKGFRAKTVAMMITNLGISGYTKNPGIGKIEKPGDLSGLRVGSFPEPSTTYVLLDAMRRQLPKEKQFAIVQAPIGSQLGLLKANRADIAVDLEPTVSIVEAQGYRVVFDLAAFSPPMAVTGIMTAQKTIDKNPQVVQRTVNALQNAMTALHDDPNVGFRVAKKLFPKEKPEVLKAALGRMMAYHMYPRSVIVQDALWQRSVQTRLETGDLKEPQATRVAVDNRFAEKAQETGQ